jgi:hypothetical protein
VNIKNKATMLEKKQFSLLNKPTNMMKEAEVQVEIF